MGLGSPASALGRLMVTWSGGDRFAAKLREIAENVGRGGVVRVGFLEGAKYPDGTSVALVATIDEFGAPSRGQPPRPAFRNMIAAKQNEWPKAIADLLVENDYDSEVALGKAGAAIAGQLRQSITEITSPALKPATIKRKGFDKPWIETSHALQSVDFEVET